MRDRTPLEELIEEDFQYLVSDLGLAEHLEELDASFRDFLHNHGPDDEAQYQDFRGALVRMLLNFIQENHIEHLPKGEIN